MKTEYLRRRLMYDARAEAARRTSRTLSRLRLATAVPGLASVVWALADPPAPLLLAAGTLLLAAFALLVVRHARVEERVAWEDARAQVNAEGVARIDRSWDALPAAAPPEAGLLDSHPYARDLDLFGRASLMQWLGPAATAPGTVTLQRWLLAPAAPADVAARQEAVRALASAADWREALAAHGRLASGIRGVEIERFLAWAEDPAPDPRGWRLVGAVVPVMTAAIGILLALDVTGAFPNPFWPLLVVAGAVLSFATSGHVHGAFNRAGAGHHAFARYARLFEHAVSSPTGTPWLDAIRARLAATGHDAPSCMRRLNRILGFAQLRSGAGILHFAVQALTLWDFHVYAALRRWQREAGRSARGWMEALGDLDALSALARVHADHPDWAMPVLSRTAVLEATALGHPLIPDDRRVSNDVTIGPPGTLVLITGSNMSGKSTLLRAIGANVVLAQAGGPACAASFSAPPVHLETSIRVQDSLEQGLSYFMAALARLKGVVDSARARAQPAAAGEPGVLYLLDELLQGTNTAERGIAVRGVVRHLLRTGAIGVMTTHDLGIAGEEPLSSAARPFHFTETVDGDGKMSFDYRLRPGLATSRNALRLMELIGLPIEEAGPPGGGSPQGS